MIAAKMQFRGAPVQILGQPDLSTLTTAAKSAYTSGKAIYDASKSGGQAGVTATSTADAYAQRLYAACQKLTVPLARSKCMAQANRDIAMRAVGQAQTAMGPAKIPTSSATGAVVTIGVVAAIGAAIWFLL